MLCYAVLYVYMVTRDENVLYCEICACVAKSFVLRSTVIVYVTDDED